ncbi:hypothetical protein HMI48_00590 [Acidithiobacillus ferrooxidans]|nr:hypothetical protein [Acidithiobacillus ferrooxidans]
MPIWVRPVAVALSLNDLGGIACVLPLYCAAGFAALLVLCVAFSQARDLIPDWVPLFGLSGSALAFETGRMRWENAANRWAREHWPDELVGNGILYY